MGCWSTQRLLENMPKMPLRVTSQLPHTSDLCYRSVLKLRVTCEHCHDLLVGSLVWDESKVRPLVEHENTEVQSWASFLYTTMFLLSRPFVRDMHIRSWMKLCGEWGNGWNVVQYRSSFISNSSLPCSGLAGHIDWPRSLGLHGRNGTQLACER